jgi:lysozyme
MIDVVLDISHHNHKPNFVLAKQSGQLAIIHKATQGTDYTDPTFSKRRQFIVDSGLWLGAYHFLTAHAPINQADHFLAATAGIPLLVADWESYQGLLPPIFVLSEFVRALQRAGRTVGVYMNQHDLITHIDEFDDAVGRCWLWVARYGCAPTVPVNTHWPTWTLWQYTDGLHSHPAPVSGIGYCDRNRFNGTLNGLARLWGKEIL